MNYEQSGHLTKWLLKQCLYVGGLLLDVLLCSLAQLFSVFFVLQLSLRSFTDHWP